MTIYLAFRRRNGCGVGIYTAQQAESMKTRATYREMFDMDNPICELTPPDIKHYNSLFYRDHFPWGDSVWWSRCAQNWIALHPRPEGKMVSLVDKKGRRFTTKVGRFLAQVSGLNQSQIQHWVLEYEMRNEPLNLVFTQDADTIALAYMHVDGPSSCMKSEMFPLDLHPARVYAGPDLALAYTEDGRNRCVVWPDRLRHTVPYGDYQRMNLSLKNMGYKFSSDFNGARIRCILDTRHDGHFILPYADFGGAAAHHDDEHFIISDTRAGYDLSSTRGTTYEDEPDYEYEDPGYY